MRRELAKALVGSWLVLAVPFWAAAQAPVPSLPKLPPLRLGVGLVGFLQQSDLTAGPDATPLGGGGMLLLESRGAGFIRPQLALFVGSSTAQYRELPQPNPLNANAPNPNTFVETQLAGGYLLLQGHLLRQRRIHPTLGAGVGILAFTPKDARGEELQDQLLTRTETETYGTTVLMVPLSVGVEAALVGRLHAQLRYQYWLTLTDYLDNVSELGTQQGNDALHSFQLILGIDL